MLEAQTPMDEYVDDVYGINIIIRRKMMKAFGSANAKGELHDLIWDSAEPLITDEVRDTLKTYWTENFGS